MAMRRRSRAAVFAISDFSRAQKGSNRSIDGEYRGYAFLIGQGVGQAAQLIAVNNQVVAYIPPAMAQQFSLDLEGRADANAAQAAVLRARRGPVVGLRYP